MDAKAPLLACVSHLDPGSRALEKGQRRLVPSEPKALSLSETAMRRAEVGTKLAKRVAEDGDAGGSGGARRAA